jgi:hypothetical protein
MFSRHSVSATSREVGHSNPVDVTGLFFPPFILSFQQHYGLRLIQLVTEMTIRNVPAGKSVAEA